MSAIIENGSDSFLADSTSGIARGLRVKLTANRRITPAAATEREIGVTKFAVTDNRTPVEVRLGNAEGSVLVQASNAFAIGDIVKRQAGGKVGAGGAGTDYGVAYEAASADGDPVVVYPY